MPEPWENKGCQSHFIKGTDCKWALELAGLKTQPSLHSLLPLKLPLGFSLMFWQRLTPLQITSCAEAVWGSATVPPRSAGICSYCDCLQDVCCGFSIPSGFSIPFLAPWLLCSQSLPLCYLCSLFFACQTAPPPVLQFATGICMCVARTVPPPKTTPFVSSNLIWWLWTYFKWTYFK